MIRKRIDNYLNCIYTGIYIQYIFCYLFVHLYTHTTQRKLTTTKIMKNILKMFINFEIFYKHTLTVVESSSILVRLCSDTYRNLIPID